MAWTDIINQGMGGLGSTLFSPDPSASVDPTQQARAQNSGLLQVGLGMLSGSRMGNPWGGALQALTGAQSSYEGAMQNSYRNSLLKHQQAREDVTWQQQQQDRQKSERQDAAVTATRLLSGLNSATDKNAYWNLVSKSPDVQSLSKLGIQLPQSAMGGEDGSGTAQQPDFNSLSQQLQAMSSATLPQETKFQSVAPGASLVGIDQTGHATPVYTTPEKPNLQKTDTGLTFDANTGQYKDSTGRALSSQEVASRDAQSAASRAAAVTKAQNQAKLDALPKGSMGAMVESYMQTGQIPPGLSRNPAMTFSFWGAVGDRAVADGNTISAQMAQTRMRGALKPAMDKTQEQLAGNQSFLGTLDKNIAAADALVQRVGGAGSPAVNEIFNKWKRGVTGDPDVAALDVLNNSINGEAAKIASGAVGSVSGASDTQIEHQRKQLNSAQNYAAWRSAANAMLLEGHNRVTSISEQRDSLLQQSMTTSTAPPGGALPPVTPPPAARTVTRTGTMNGKKVVQYSDGSTEYAP